MFKHCFSFLLLALVAVQAYPQYELHAFEVESSERDLEVLISFTEIMEKIKELAQKVLDYIKQFTGIFTDIANKIKEIIGIGSWDDIVKKIVDTIKGMISGATEKVNACIDKKMPEIKEFAQKQQEEANKCVDAGKEGLTTIETKALELKDKATKALKKAATDAAKCLLPPSSTCLNAAWTELKNTMSGILTEVTGLLDDAKLVGTGVVNCGMAIKDNIQTEIQKEYAEILDCVNEETTTQIS